MHFFGVFLALGLNYAVAFTCAEPLLKRKSLLHLSRRGSASMA